VTHISRRERGREGIAKTTEDWLSPDIRAFISIYPNIKRDRKHFSSLHFVDTNQTDCISFPFFVFSTHTHTHTKRSGECSIEAVA